MTKLAPPLWEKLRTALRDGQRQELAAIEKKAKELPPDLRSAIEAQIQAGRGQGKQALERLQKTMGDRALGPYEQLTLGFLYLDSDATDQAAKAFEAALKAQISDPGCSLERASCSSRATSPRKR